MWCRKCSGYARQRMGPKLLNCCRPEREWSTGSSTSSGQEDKRDAEIKELRAQIQLLQKNSGGAEQGGKAFHWGKKVDWRKSGVWTLRMRLRIERNWMRRGKKLQKNLREVEKLSCVPKEDQDRLKNDLQQRLLGVEQRRHDILPDHQKVQTRSQKIQSTKKTKEGTCRKKMLQHKKRC